MSDLREDGWYWLRHASGDVVANLCEGVFVSVDGDFHGDDEEIEVLSRIPTPDEPWQMVPLEATPRMTRMMCLSSEPEAVEWDGEGKRPPAGRICMLRNRSLDGVSCPAYIEYMSEQSCVWSWRDDGPERTMHAHPSALEFRPIRSEEDRLTDEALEEIEDDGDDKRTIRSTVARMIHAGYRKG